MGCVYVLRNGTRNEFKIGRTKGSKQLAHQANSRLSEFAEIQTEDEIACETFLHQRLRSMRIINSDGTEFFEVSPSELAQALHEAEEFVDEFLKAKQQAEDFSRLEEAPNARLIAPSASDLEIYSKLLKVREAQDRLKVRRQFFESKLKVSIGFFSGIEGLATWKGSWQKHFDLLALRKQDPDLYAGLFDRFGNETYKRTFRVRRSPDLGLELGREAGAGSIPPSAPASQSA